jgi:hypothetical protein
MIRISNEAAMWRRGVRGELVMAKQLQKLSTD